METRAEGTLAQPMPTRGNHSMTGTTGVNGHGGHDYTAAELILMTEAEAEGLIETLDAIKAAPADEKPNATDALAEQVKSRGWSTRAADLSAALHDRLGGLRPGPKLELAWEI